MGMITTATPPQVNPLKYHMITVYTDRGVNDPMDAAPSTLNT